MPLPAALVAKKGAMMAARRMAIRGARNPGVRRTVRGQLARVAHSQRNAVDGYQNERRRQIEMRSMAKGGKVRKSGLVYLHKGERVVPVSKVKKVDKCLRKMCYKLRLPNSNTTVKIPGKLLITSRPRNLARIGGKVMKTGPHKVSKGQRVIPVAKVKRVDKILRKK